MDLRTFAQAGHHLLHWQHGVAYESAGSVVVALTFDGCLHLAYCMNFCRLDTYAR